MVNPLIFMAINDGVKQMVDTLLKIGMGILAFVCVTIFNDMHTDLKKVSADLVELRERMARIEGKINK